MSSPLAYSPSAKGDDEEASQRASSDRGKVLEIVRVAPQDDSRAAGHMGEKAPMETGGEEGRVQFGPRPDSTPETDAAPKSSTQPPSKEGGMRIPPVTPVQPGPPDNLLEAL